MGNVADYMFDTSFLKEALAYLKQHHKIQAIVVDHQDEIVPFGTFTKIPNQTASTFFPFEFPENIGGLKCFAEHEGDLKEAAPHIKMCLKTINFFLQRELEMQQAGDEILLLSAQLNFLHKLAGKIIGINNLNKFCQTILTEITASIKADQAFIETKGRWEEKLIVPVNLTIEETGIYRQDEVFKKQADNRTIIFFLKDRTSVLKVPIREKDGVAGYMALIRKNTSEKFSAYDKKFAAIIDNIVSPSIETLRLYDSLQDLYVNTVKALAMAIDAKDKYTHGHSYRVAKYSVAIGRKLKIPEKNLQDLEIAAYMHDLGKIGIAESILGKPGKLTNEEFDEVKKHPAFTDKILKPIHLPDFIVDAAVQHHERLNGGGYPFGLKGDAICGFARIIAVADVFDAMTSARPYRGAMSVEQTMQIICKGAGLEFDKRMVLALISSLQDESGDPEITQIYRDLKFGDYQGLNLFLVNISSKLAPAEGDEDRPVMPANCKPLLDKASDDS